VDIRFSLGDSGSVISWLDECEEKGADSRHAAATGRCSNCRNAADAAGDCALFAGNFFYTDYRNLLVFAPFSLPIGVVMIIFALRVGK
jgi:hypothetical protein